MLTQQAERKRDVLQKYWPFRGTVRNRHNKNLPPDIETNRSMFQAMTFPAEKELLQDCAPWSDRKHRQIFCSGNFDRQGSPLQNY